MHAKYSTVTKKLLDKGNFEWFLPCPKRNTKSAWWATVHWPTTNVDRGAESPVSLAKSLCEGAGRGLAAAKPDFHLLSVPARGQRLPGAPPNCTCDFLRMTQCTKVSSSGSRWPRRPGQPALTGCRGGNGCQGVTLQFTMHGKSTRQGVSLLYCRPYLTRCPSSVVRPTCPGHGRA